MNLKDVCFTVPVRVESEERKKNIELVIDFLIYHFKPHIFIWEEAKESKLSYLNKSLYIKYEFEKTDDDYFYRTRCLNNMAKATDLPFIVNYDADVLADPQQYVHSLKILKNNEADMVYPFDGTFYDVPKYLHERIRQDKSVNFLTKEMCHWIHSQSVGGAVFWNREKFIEIGMENQNFCDWGWEDDERVTRATKLGLEIRRVPGTLWHLTHSRGPSSGPGNPFYKRNLEELKKIKQIDKKQLLDYIKTWDWLEKKQ